MLLRRQELTQELVRPLWLPDTPEASRPCTDALLCHYAACKGFARYFSKVAIISTNIFVMILVIWQLTGACKASMARQMLLRLAAAALAKSLCSDAPVVSGLLSAALISLLHDLEASQDNL